jgi:hypothetical protein
MMIVAIAIIVNSPRVELGIKKSLVERINIIEVARDTQQCIQNYA